MIGIFSVIGLTAQNTGNAQSVVISVEYRKGNTYLQSLDSRSHTITTYKGNSNHLKELKAKGLKNPSVSDKALQLKCTTRCLPTQANGRTMMQMQFSKAQGSSLKLPKVYTSLIHLHQYTGKEPVVDSVSHKMKPEEYKSQWLPMIQTMLGQFNFITKRLNVNNEVKEQTVQQFPVNGKSHSILVTTIYILKKATADSAWLDINSTFALKDPKQTKVALKGIGKGQMVYDIKNKVIARRTVKSQIETIVIQGNISAESVEENIIRESVRMVN